MSEPWSAARIAAELTARPALAAWTFTDERLRRELTFADFRAAFAFMTRVAALAEEQGHHPDWTNVYNRVSIALWTHDAGGITAKDLRLARAIESQVLAD